MKTPTIAIFDIGKTNKKVMLFNKSLDVVYQHEEVFDETADEDGFPCDDIDRLEQWLTDILQGLLADERFMVCGINFATYGASLACLDRAGKRLLPVYNYLKPMPDGVMDGFYEAWGGVDEFSRATASPAMGMLNSGLQIWWLKRARPDLYSQVAHILHFPQYLSYLLTRQIVSEYTSIGCHTAMWDFDNHRYHPWLATEGILLPAPVANDLVMQVRLPLYMGPEPSAHAALLPRHENHRGLSHTLAVGTGIHDSSASLVPYLRGADDPFVLISTGTWGIFMNPFNDEPLTAEELRKDTLCYMSVNQKQVKSARLFMGHMHEVYTTMIASHFGLDAKFFKTVACNQAMLDKLDTRPQGERIFFANDLPPDQADRHVDLSRFSNYQEAYHQLMIDLTRLSLDTLALATPENDQSKVIYISGGFARNDLFVKLMTMWLPQKKVYTTEVDNATALGAAMVIYEKAFNTPLIFAL